MPFGEKREFPHLILYDQLGTMLIFATYGAVILSLYSGERSDVATIIKRALLFPPTTALMIGLALRNWTYPQVVVNTLEDLGGVLTALVMTAIGFQIKLRLQRTTLKPLGAGLAIKLIIAPLIALLGCRLFGLDSLAAEISIFEAGMPPMVTACALAAAAGHGAWNWPSPWPDLALCLPLLTLPLLYTLIQYF